MEDPKQGPEGEETFFDPRTLSLVGTDAVHVDVAGKFFHRARCSMLGEDVYIITRSVALERGLTPCLICGV